MSFRKRSWLANVDWLLVAVIFAICGVGIALLYSAGFSPASASSASMKRQLYSLLAGFLAFTFCAFFNASFWKRYAFLFYLIGCGLLLLILFNGTVAGGSRRWLDLGSFRVQPSEFMKIALILALAKAFSSDSAPKDGYGFVSLLAPMAVLLVPVVLIQLEPDLGTALCHVLIGGSMLLLAGVKGQTLFRLAMVGLALLVPAWSILKEYQKKRIISFLSPEADPLGSGYHAIQSKIAVGSGAMFGKGYLEGTQTQLRFLPEQTTDFIFSVLAEEWGFVGSIVVLCLYAFLIVRLFMIAYRSQDKFTSFMSFGVAALIFWQVVINIGMVIGVLPVVGLTLVLLSYGGSSLVSVLAGLGIVVGCSSRKFMFK